MIIISLNKNNYYSVQDNLLILEGILRGVSEQKQGEHGGSSGTVAGGHHGEDPPWPA